MRHFLSTLTLFFVCFTLGFSQENQTKIITVPNRTAPSLKRYTTEEKLELLSKSNSNHPSVQTVGNSINPTLSAEATSVARFQDIPVNLFTGTPIVSVPLYTLQEGLLSVPISLDYNASGMKNQEVANWTGAGWNLNAGGQITRIIKGEPDEGYVKNGTNYKGYFKYGFNGSNDPDHDTEPDIFLLTINGSTYRFMYRYYNQEAKFEVLGMEEMRIIPNFEYLSGNSTVGKFVGFDITLADGTHYIFGNGATESATSFETHQVQDGNSYPGTTSFTNNWKATAFTSVWFLKKIVSAYGQEINFEYDNVAYSYYQIGEDQAPSEVCPEPSEVTKTINKVYVKSVSLAQINGINTKIEFNKRYRVCTEVYDFITEQFIEECEYQDTSPARLDLDSWGRYPQSQSNVKRLMEMMVMDNGVSTPQDTLFYKFSYGYFTGYEDDLPNGYTTTDVGTSHQKRLRLEKIDFPDKTQARFRYRGDSPSYNGKSRLNYGIDHWGYANGHTGNRLLTGLIPKDSDYPGCTAPTSNRESDANFSFYGSLDSLIFTNRKWVRFDYELHNASNYKDASNNYIPIGGVRVKSIEQKDLLSSITTKKQYTYTLDNGASSGFLVMKPTYRYYYSSTLNGSNSGLYERLLSELGRPPVGYSRVTESITNAQNQGLGKTVYHFEQELETVTTKVISIQNCQGQYPNTICDTINLLMPERINPDYSFADYAYQLGAIARIETFNEANDTLSIKTMAYEVANYGFTTGARVVKINGETFGYLTNSYGNFYTEPYNFDFKLYHLRNEFEKTFSPQGTNPITTTKTYGYTNWNTKNRQVKWINTTSTHGLSRETYLLYPFEINFGLDTIHHELTCYDEYGLPYDCSYDDYLVHVPVAGSRARGIYEYLNAHILSTPIEIYINSGIRNGGAKAFTIRAFNKPSGGFNYAPYQSFQIGGKRTQINFIYYNRSQNDTITLDASYFETQKITDYNQYGLPTSIKTYAGPVSAIDYDVSELRPIRRRFNVGGVVVDSSFTSYTHPIFGANKIIGTNELSQSVEYDTTFRKGMVKIIRDKDNHILQQNDYFEAYEQAQIVGLTTDNSKVRSIVRSPRIATITDLAIGDSVSTQLSYSDGEGRLLQSKIVGSSPQKKDVVGSVPIYDNFGRVKKSYLPVPTPTNKGSFVTTIPSLAATFYGDTAAYSEVREYEASPLSRIFKQIGVGQTLHQNNKEGIQAYETGSFGIKKIEVDDYSFSFSTLRFNISVSTYTGNELIKQISTDEQGYRTVNYFHKTGALLEKHIQFRGEGTSPDDYLKTTYLYDRKGRLVVVLPPAMYGQFDNITDFPARTSSLTASIYVFIHDDYDRLLESHTPDGGWNYYIYNRLGQVVLTQNARQRDLSTPQWTWRKYGARENVVQTGTLISNYDYSYNPIELQQLFDNYTEDKQFEERTPTGLEGYTTRSFPPSIQALITANDIKTVNFYDEYAWNTNSALHFSQYKTPRWQNSKGLLTGSKVKRLDTNEWLATAFYYDDQNRLIQSQSQNRYGLVNQTDIVMDFIGQVLEEHTIYRKPATANLEVATRYSYDHAGRKTQALHLLNGKTETLASYQYDELGRLITKKLNEAAVDSIKRNAPLETKQVTDVAKKFVLLEPGTCIVGDSVYAAFIASGLQHINYAYNISGNLRGINLTPSGRLDSSKVFALKLDYNEDNRYYNGLLSTQSWKSSQDTTTRKFVYSYDKANRIAAGNYYGKGDENFSLAKLTYDANGNIDTLQRYGNLGATNYGLFDNLKYHYPSLSNSLSGITDAANDTIGFVEAPSGGLGAFTYYADGSTKTDANKGITNISYNYLGLIERVDFGTSKRIENVYTADGVKLQTLFINATDTLKKEYIGDLIYVNDTLRSCWHDEGRIIFNNTPFGGLGATYQYFINDHLGNVRVVFQQLSGSVYLYQEVHYGVTGEILDGLGKTGDLSYLYQGKELIEGLGYDFQARMYDTWSMRFGGIDPVDNYMLSGYAGMMNNPVSYIDPDGRTPTAVIGALIGAASYTLGIAFTNGGFNNWSWMDFGISTITGAVTAGIASGIGATAMNIKSSVGRFAFQTASHSVLGGISSSMNGGTFRSGLLTGATGSIFSSATYRLPIGAQIGGAALFSGLTAELSGGNFWQGAAQGGIIAGFNHAAHSIYERIALTAEKYIGSKNWAYDAQKDNFDSGTNKCNKFCFDVLEEAGASPGTPNHSGFIKTLLGLGEDYPPTAGQWADPNFKIDGWKVVQSPRRGDVVAYSYAYSDATGHVAIMNSAKTSVGANHNIVRQTDFGYTSTHLPSGSKYVYRRYVGH